MSKITEVAELVEKGKAKLVGAAVQGALDEGCDATEIPFLIPVQHNIFLRNFTPSFLV